MEEINPWSVPDLEVYHLWCCPECDSKLTEKSQFIDHALTMHPKAKDFVSEDKVPKDEPTMEESETKEMDIEIKPDLKCDICQRKNSSVMEFIDHLITEHDEIIEYKDENAKPKAFICDCDQFVTYVKPKMITHLNDLHPDNDTLFCHTCAAKCKTKKILKDHYHAKHERKYCDLCDKSFMKFSDFVEHKRIKHKVYNITEKDKNKSCLKCHTSFNDPRKFDTHIIECLGIQRRMKCKLCETFWASHFALEFHIVVGHEMIMHCCDTCEYVTNQKQKMVEHKKSTHDGVKQFKCQICDKRFFRREHLKVHKATKHDIGQKNFKCEACRWQGISQHELNRHFGRKHIRKYKCDICGEAFFRTKHVNDHKEEVHGIVVPENM